MSVTVKIPTHLARYSDGRAELAVEGATLAEVLDSLDRECPGIRFRIINEQDEIREHIRIAVGEEVARTLAHPVPAGETVMLIAALSGG